MRPPMTTTKNDGVPPAHRKTQLTQKEVLVENQKIRLPHHLNAAKDELSRIRIHQISFDEFVERRSESNVRPDVYSPDDGSDITRPSDNFPNYRQTNSKLKRFSSDVSDKVVANSKIPLVSRNISSSNLNSNKSNKNPSLQNVDEVPKNLIINALEQCQSSPAVVLPLSETEPLLTNIETTVADPTRSICLNKNSASLIFTKKDIPNSNSSDRISSSASCNPANIVHRRSSGATKHTSSSSHRQSDYTAEDILLQHRRSLQLNYSTISKDSNTPIRNNTTAVNRKQHAYSWYAPVYSALEEEIEQDSRESSPIHNLATLRNNNKTENEAVSLLEKNHLNIQPQLHQTRIRRAGVCSLPTNGVNGISVTTSQNENEGPHAPSLLGGPLPRRRRFENFLKSLVGRKPSKESTTTTTTTSNPPLLPSPEITISPSPSDHDLLRDPGGLSDKITSSTTSLNTMQHKIWNVVPLLKREGSATSLRQEKSNSIVQYTGLRKCETVLALARQSSMIEQIKPQNRLRNSLSVINHTTCSRCSSLLSLAATGSRYSLNPASSGFLMSVNGGSINNLFRKSSSNINVSSTPANSDRNESLTCKLCLVDVTGSEVTSIGHCGCRFCTECMKTYVELEISEGAYEISCPDAQCPVQGIITLSEMGALTSAELMEKHHRYRLNREIELDKTRTWCPRAGCETVCLVGTTPTASSSSTEDKVNSITHVLCAVQCPTCREEFCSGCKKPWHSNLSCEENNRRLIDEGQDDSIAILFDNDLIKCCPMCAVPIEKDEGCAQMMCKRCKHVFCWYCLASLDDDFLLRHYDKGPCKNKLGHSRASVVWHRAQVIGIFAGFGILLLVASPLLLLAAPCIICCKCRICSGSTKLEDGDPEFDEAMMALQRYWFDNDDMEYQSARILS